MELLARGAIMGLRTIVGIGVGAALLVTQFGCNCFHKNEPYRPPYDQPRPYNPSVPVIPATARPGGPEVQYPEPFAPSGVPVLPTPGGTPSRFGATYAEPAAPAPTPSQLLPPTNVPVDARYFAQPRVTETSEPPLAPSNRIGNGNKSADPKPGDPRLLPPGLLDPQPSAKIPVTSNSAPSPVLPVGIDSFSVVMDQVATGLKPADTEGFDWLQSNKYKTIIFLRRPGTANSADKEQVERRNMKYLTFEVSPEAMNASLVAEFCRAIAERSARPLFVYDKDGTLSGAMWYTYFRSVEKLSPADAKKRATEFGLKPAETGDHSALWTATQKVTQE
jgi:protein tyrosine phosphatase (PTP) superfamily phosphohydrolase (DUF442 family)